jgi:hypothetical protein
MVDGDVLSPIDVANARVRMGILKHFEPRRPGWRELAHRTVLVFGHPKRCLLCVVETAFATGNMRNFGVMNDKLLFDTCFDFKTALECARLSPEEAIGYGLLRAADDPVTFYATLRKRWQKEFRE